MNWKKYEGERIDGKFALQEFLGGSVHHAAFLTNRGDQKAVIKLVSAKDTAAEHQLSRWRAAAQLSHPNLLQLFETGRWQFAGNSFAYVVMEYAEENLSQILPQRALTPEEARDLLGPVVSTLVFLHDKQFAHGRLKPANIHATGDHVKLSSDSLCGNTENHRPERVPSEKQKSLQQAAPYDAAELATSGASAAGDIWSLGITLVEALTQKTPALPAGDQVDPIVPDSLPAPFLEIARYSLKRDLQQRWNAFDIAAHLDPTAPKPISSSTPAGANSSPRTVSPVPVRLPSPVPLSSPKIVPPSFSRKITPVPATPISPLAIPLSSVPAVPKSKPGAPAQRARRPVFNNANKESALRTILLTAVCASAIVMAAIMIVSRLTNRHRVSAPSSAFNSEQQSAAKKLPASSELSSAKSQHLAKNHFKQDSVKSANAPIFSSNPPGQNTVQSPNNNAAETSSVTPSNTSLHTTVPQPTKRASGSDATRGEVLDQVLPDVSQKARDTIHGTVRVSVRIHVDPAGRVTQAELDSQSSSKYFSDLALKASRKWEFQSPEVSGRSVPSEWLVHFSFSSTDTQATSKQIAP